MVEWLSLMNSWDGCGGCHLDVSLTHRFPQADTSAPITLRTRKFITNRLLARRQFVLDVLHPSRPNVSKAELSEKLASMYKTDKNRVVTFGFRTQFGGGRSTGFALIYDDEASQKKFEPKYRLVRVSQFI
jgi:small subunit ribosomal protein S24e